MCRGSVFKTCRQKERQRLNSNGCGFAARRLLQAPQCQFPSTCNTRYFEVTIPSAYEEVAGGNDRNVITIGLLDGNVCTFRPHGVIRDGCHE